MKRSPQLRVINNPNESANSADSAPEAGFRPQPSSPEEAIALPDLHEVELDWDGVNCVLADLDDFAEILEIQLRSSKADAQKTACVVEARDAFHRGDAHGLQIVYRFADQTWCDTLLRGNNGARLLRLADPMRAHEH